MDSCNTGRVFFRKFVGAMLCVALLGAIMVQASLAETPIWEYGTKAASAGQGMSGGGLFAISSAEGPGMDGVAGRSSDGMEITTAEIRAEGVTNQALSDGSSFTVDFSKQFTLHIAVESKLNLANKKVEITVPDGLTVVEYPIPERGGMAESVTPESIDDLHSVNNYGGYCPTNGTITYSLKNTAEKNSFNIVLAPDTVLWNRTKEQTLENALKIRVYTDGTDGQTYQELSATPKITGEYNDTADDNRAIQTGPRLSRVGVKTGVPTAANQPFALRQIWINPDKDYIDMPQFFKKLEITIALPYYTKNGSNIYAELDHVTYDPAGQSTRPNLLDPKNHKDADGGYKDGFNFKKTQNDIDHTVTLTWENLYLEYGQDYFTPYFKWTSDCDVTTTDAVKWGSNSILNTGKKAPGCYEGKTPTAGAASAVGGTITWQDDSIWYLYNGDCTTFSFTAQAGESMSVSGKANNQPIYNNYTSDSGITYYLGQFHVVNQGGDKSAAKTVEFTYRNNDKIGVTAQKIPATTGNTVEVWYTTTTNPTEQKYSGSLTSSGGFVTFTADMASLVEGEYFTKIKASVGSYEKDYVGYVSSRDQDPTSGYATTFGKLLTAEAGTYTNFASMKMYDTASGDSTAKSDNYTVKVTNTRGEIPLAMEQAYEENSLERLPILSKTSATAGETITFNGLLSSSAYPYSSNNVTTDQEIYIRLPEKITVENLKLYQEEGRTADKVFLLDAVMETVKNPRRTEIPETAYKFEAVTSAEAGYKLYKITFTNQDDPAKVGWFTDGLGQYQIGISFDMKIAKDADAMTLDMRDCVRFKSASLTSTSNNGTLAQYQVMDDGVRYSTFNVNAKGTKLSVVAARLGLTFTFGARMTDKNSTAVFDATKYSSFENDKQKVYLKDADHVVDMLFTLKNETGRAFSKEDAQAFYYFIPVPKKGDLWDSHMQDTAFEFDMNLTRAPELWIGGNHQGEIQVTYATDIESTATAGEAKHYTNTDNYMTEDKLLEGCTTEAQKAERWREVKMIRIAAKPDTASIPRDAELKVNMRLEPTFNENANFVGSEINFGPCGVSPYSVGNTLNQGHNPLPRIQVEFQTGIIAGKIFIDKNFNGTYEKDTDELYTGSVTVEANHSNGNENCTEGDAAHKATATGGTFSFNGRRADTYHVVVTNPGSTDANGNNPLKFSLPESGGKFSLDAGKNTATASVVLDMNEKPNDIVVAKDLMIGFQQPHTVNFTAENATLTGNSTTKVWHGEKLVAVPNVNDNEGFRFTGNWTDGTNTYTADKLKEVAISSDVTFTAEVKQLYTLTYDLNGGSGANAPAASTHIEGEKVSPDYTDTEKLKKGDKTIFVGWSETRIENPLPADAAKDDIDTIISTDEYTMPARNVTLYAVYAVDANDNGKPDYNDDAVHVRYHGNNNVREDILCPHHHVAGATAKLSTNGTVSGKSLGHDKPASAAGGEVTSHTFTFTDKTTGNAHIFIGWSTSPILDTIIKTKADYDGLASSIVTEVTMEKAKVDGGNADDDGNTNVYAVWAADRNGNKTADYLEEYTLTYDGNAQQGGTVTNLPTDTDIHIPGDEVTLSSAVPIHDDVDGKTVVFIGWTEAQTNAIFSRADTAPTTTTKVTFASANKKVYAAWGYDENNNGTADVLETYTLTYNLNGGSVDAPAKVTGVAKNAEITLTAEKNFTRNLNEIFVGWSVTKLDDALTAETKQEDVEKFLIAPGAKYRIQTEDVTLYAVWAIDSNGDGTPDYQTTYTVIYDLDGGTAADGETYDEETVKPGGTITVKAAPIRKGYAFAGWSDGMTIHQPGDIVTVLGADLLLSARWERDTGSLSVTKVVAGDAGETNRNFNFTVTLVDGAAANVSGRYGDMDFDNGVATFTLKDGEEKNATGLPADCAYTVTEAEANQDGYTTTKTGDTGTIEANETAVATFTNTKKLVGPSDPTDSKDPTKPDGPTDSKDPTKPDGLTDSKSPVDALPGTGDDVVLFARLALFGALLAAIIAVAMRGKRG
ncbi:InlB B-repeat-containing protein [Collinsella provencensis]|uniref:InlB B-repeat-containing protein n=1 Tax=Collinsella provencensis TaxID=1937461 RepID=UPI00131BC748|nr:InlB B-repeat-containing protein [Collinsella provencensis]